MRGNEIVKVLFVCLGNICRSPTAEGFFRELVRQEGLDHCIETDSAGTHGYHVGRAPDSRAQQAALKRGIDIKDLRGRQVSVTDFDYYDWIIAMDDGNLANLRAESQKRHLPKIHRLLDFATEQPVREVPDPYYGGDEGFEHVMDLVELGTQGLLQAIRKKHGLP